MSIYQKFLIRDTDSFDPDRYPRLEESLSLIETDMNAIPSVYKTEMLLGFLKQHPVKAEWIEANPPFAEMIQTRAPALNDLKALFASCSHHPAFRTGLEEYIENRFNGSDLRF